MKSLGSRKIVNNVIEKLSSRAGKMWKDKNRIYTKNSRAVSGVMDLKFLSKHNV